MHYTVILPVALKTRKPSKLHEDTFFNFFKYALRLTVIKGTLGGFLWGFTQTRVKPGLLG